MGRRVGGRPNSFFGMSLIMDEGRYTPDFQQMFKWFEYIFEKLLERGIIFKKNEAGTIQYRIDKLEEASEDVEWVKANLPKIFSQEAATRILYYDNSFTQGQAGKVACFNDEESEKNLLTAFREFRWIILSPGFEKSIELNAGELKERLGELNGKLAPIATQVAIGNWKGSENDLGQMRREAENACVNIDKYLSSIRDEEERKTFSELLSRYKEFCGNIHQLQYTLLKQNQSTPGTIENRKTEEAEKRKEAKSQIEENKEQETTYINEKWNNQFPPTSNISGEQIVKLKKYGLIGGSVLLLLCLVGMFAFNDKQERATVSDKTTASLNDSHKDEHWVDSKVFNDYINNNAIADAYNYLKDKENKSDYIFQLKSFLLNY